MLRGNAVVVCRWRLGEERMNGAHNLEHTDAFPCRQYTSSRDPMSSSTVSGAAGTIRMIMR